MVPPGKPAPPADRRPRALSVALALTVPVALLCGPLFWHSALPAGSDVYATAHYLQGFMKAFSEGDLYPRWTDNSIQGLGAPTFVMLPPLNYYSAGAASWLAGSTILGLKLHILLVSVLSALGFYALARQWIGPGIPAALSAGIYLLLPYHVLDVYQRFAMSETAAFIFYPLVLLFARRAMLVGGAWDLTGLALSYAGLIGTHIVTALPFSLFLGLWLLWEARGRWRPLVRPVLGLVCGLGLAAPALLPAVIERASANISWVKEMPNGDFHINFIFKDEMLPGLGFKDPVKPPVLKSAHSQLLLGAVAAALGLAWTARSQSRRRHDILALAAGLGLAYFMQLEVSTPIWSVVPELATIQFPWRLQTLMVLTAGLLAGFALSAGWGRAGGARASGRSLTGAGALLLGGAALANLALSVQNAHLKSFDYDEARDRSPGVTYWSEPSFTPIGFRRYRDLRRIRFDMPGAEFIRGSGRVEVLEWISSRRRLRVDSPAGGTVRLRSFWFPGWTGAVDGRPLALEPSKDDSMITFDAPAGTHEVEVRFETTPVRRAGAMVGLGSLLGTALLAALARRHRPGWSLASPSRQSG